MLQLIPGSDVAAATETFAIDQKKAAWTPAPTHLRTKSFPTPYAQAEMMSHVLGLLSLDPGVRPPPPENVPQNLEHSYARGRLLFLALVLGEVLIDTLDLRRPEAQNLGTMLADLRPEGRYIGLLRDARQQGPEGRKLLVGATDPSCLFWCSPRASMAYWSELKTRIDASADRGDAIKLLADWRGILDRANLWAPGHEQAPPWMKALQVLLGDTQGAGGLSTDARFVGPLRVTVVAPEEDTAAAVMLYLPVRDPGAANRFAELLFFQPLRRDTGTVDLVDPNQRTVVTVRMSSGAATVDGPSIAGFELLAGVGKLEGNANVARGHGQAHWLEDHDTTQGYRSLVLNPLLAAAARSRGRPTITDADVQAFPIGFPDAVRLVVGMGMDNLPGGVRIVLSRAVTNRLATGTPAPQTGLALSAWAPNTSLPRVIAVPGATGAVSVGLVEGFGVGARAVDVGEIRALGLGLWLYFTGEAEVRADGARVIWSADDGRELFGRVLVHTTERPLEVLGDALSAVHSEAERTRTRDRLATLQRFWMTWRSVGDGAGEQPDVQCARLGRVAAETFVHWAMADAPLGSFGVRATAPREHYAISPAYRLPLYLDGYARWE